MAPQANINIERDVSALARMTIGELRAKHSTVFGEPSRSGNREFLSKRIAWRLQSLAEGGLSERARQRAADLARDADVRITAPRTVSSAASTGDVVTAALSTRANRLPIPGTVLTREYRGKVVNVRVLERGFEFDGRVYRSLSAVAKAITGSHWNGYLFFGLNNGANA